MHRTARRILLLVSVAVSAAVIPAVSAQAKVLHVTGTQTTITPSSSLTTFLVARKITVTAVAPATLSGGTLTLPITGGTVRTPKLQGRLVMGGGLRLTRNGHSLTLSSLVVRRHGSKNDVTAQVGTRRATIARATGVKIATSGKTATVSGELRLSAVAAHAINKFAGKHIVSAGADLGSFSSTVTVA